MMKLLKAEFIRSLSQHLDDKQSLLVHTMKIQLVNIESKKIPEDLPDKCDFESMDKKTKDIHIVQKYLIVFRKFVKKVKKDGQVRYDKPFINRAA